MRCEDAREQIDEVRYGTGRALATQGAGADDGGQQPGPGLAEHLASCTACSAYRADGSALDALLALDEATTPGPGFDTRLFAHVDGERRARRRRRMWRWSWALVPVGLGAAIALLGVQPRPHAGGGAEATHGSSDGVFSEIPQEDVALMLELELLEDLPVVQQLDEIEAFEALEDIDEATLDAILEETP